MSVMQVVSAIIEDDHGLVLIAQRPAGKLLAGFWEFPGGKIEPGETAPEALARELKEELGLEVAIGRFMGIFRHKYDWGEIDLHVYVTRANNAPRRTDQVSVFKWVNPTRINVQELAEADVKPYQLYMEQTAN